MKKLLAMFAVLVILTGCQSINNEIKNIKSEFSGLNRTVTLYSENGDPIKSWTGKFDINVRSDGRILFDVDGKRVTVKGGIIVSEEND